MNDIVYELIKIVVMITAFVVARYLIPLIKEKTKTEQFQKIAQYVKAAVLFAQQVYWDQTGEDKKQTVMLMVRTFIHKAGYEIADEQINTLIEAAVKEMKMAEVTK